MRHDLRPSEQRMSWTPHTVEDMKVLGDPEIGDDMAGRYKGVHFGPTQPTIFTSSPAACRAFLHSFMASRPT